MTQDVTQRLTPAQRSNFLPVTAWGYAWWRSHSLTLLSGEPFPLTREERLFLRLAQPQSGEHWLDMGTSTGFYAGVLARQGCLVDAIDLSRMMLKEAAQREPSELITWRVVNGENMVAGAEDSVGGVWTPRHPSGPSALPPSPTRVEGKRWPPSSPLHLWERGGSRASGGRGEGEVQQQNSHRSPNEPSALAAAAFDGITIGATLNETANPARMLREAAKLLKPGGRLWLMYAVNGGGLGQKLLGALGGLTFPDLTWVERQVPRLTLTDAARFGGVEFALLVKESP